MTNARMSSSRLRRAVPPLLPLPALPSSTGPPNPPPSAGEALHESLHRVSLEPPPPPRAAAATSAALRRRLHMREATPGVRGGQVGRLSPATAASGRVDLRLLAPLPWKPPPRRSSIRRERREPAAAGTARALPGGARRRQPGREGGGGGGGLGFPPWSRGGDTGMV